MKPKRLIRETIYDVLLYIALVFFVIAYVAVCLFVGMHLID